MAQPTNLSYLEIVALCDNQISPTQSQHPSDTGILWTFRLSDDPTSPKLGLIRPSVLDRLHLENELSKTKSTLPLFIFSDPSLSRPYVGLHTSLDTPSKRTEALRELCERWRDEGIFDGVCGPSKWRGELYPVYKAPFGVQDHPNHFNPPRNDDNMNFAFEMERSCCALFGIVTYGVHLSIYQHIQADGKDDIAIWVPTRSATKSVFPSMLDNTVAGGIPSGMAKFESMVKECEEEASLPPDLIERHAKAVAAISYFFVTAKGYLQPEIEYVYDIAIPLGTDPAPFHPRPSDGEVESFKLMERKQVIEKMKRGLFKPNCALVLIDLFMRLGYITPDNEPDYMEISTRLHGRFGYDAW
ncbi:nudix hydrolase 20 [Flagelloscypha sp. PMI_526]|nr:nudix hydrolase 20 [Flagelloscypha sp. PMI_526]